MKNSASNLMAEIKTFRADSTAFMWEISELSNGHHVTCYDPDQRLGGSGFSSQRDEAKKIAFAELNERYLVRQLNADKIQRQVWDLIFDESGSGFATGFSEQKAILRAVCEAAERWALSKWIDDRLALTPVGKSPARLAQDAAKYFDECSVLKVEVPVLIQDQLIKIQVAVVLGWTKEGVFAGYGARMSLNEAIDHAYIEAVRNFVIAQNQATMTSFPFDRIHFFAKNRKSAEETLAVSRSDSWPLPVLRFLKTELFGEIWLARAVFDGWTPWQRGEIARFLY
jgi:hypothetical protein